MRETVMKDEEAVVVYSRANENVARAVAYFGPLLFWGVVSVIACGILLLG